MTRQLILDTILERSAKVGHDIKANTFQTQISPHFT